MSGVESTRELPYYAQTEQASAYLLHEMPTNNFMLFDADLPWLEKLAGRPLNQHWLVTANEHIKLGSIDTGRPQNLSRTNEVTHARHEFFRYDLGWGDKTHRLNPTYNNLMNQNIKLVQPQLFIAGQRMLYSFGIDNVTALKRNPQAAAKPPRTIRTMITELAGAGFNSPELISEEPVLLNFYHEIILKEAQGLVDQGFEPSKIDAHMLLPKEYRDKMVDEAGLSKDNLVRATDIGRIAAIFGRQVDGPYLLARYPKLRYLKDSRFRAQTRMLAQFGSPDMRIRTAVKLARLPLEAQVLAVTLNKGLDVSEITELRDAITTKELRSIVGKMLEDDRALLAARLGPRTLQAFEAWFKPLLKA